jgi:chromosome partitioning protein
MRRKLGPMRSLAITAQKGGVGKTTLTVHLAVAALRAGERVLILDADPQGSCVTWASLRDREEPHVERIEPADVAARLEQASSEGYSLALVDTQPRASSSLALLLRAVDYAIVPLRPSAFDLATLEQSLSIVEAAGRPGAIVLNACPSRSAEVAETRESIADLSLPLAPIEIGERRIYSRAVGSGQAVVEFQPISFAAMETASLWKFVYKNLSKGAA